MDTHTNRQLDGRENVTYTLQIASDSKTSLGRAPRVKYRKFSFTHSSGFG